jgi:hypothetical protein
MRKTVLVASVSAALAASSLAGPPASAAVVDPAPTDRVVIDILTLSGCSAGTAMVAASADNAHFRLWYDRFQVQIGPNTYPFEARSNCQVSLSIHMPAGAAYAIDRVDYGGYALLAPGAVFTQRARHYRTGQALTPPFRSHSFTSPYEDMWQTVDTFSADELFFPPCGTNPDFNAVLNLRLDAGTSDPAIQTSFGALDSIDGPYDGATYYLRTKPC